MFHLHVKFCFNNSLLFLSTKSSLKCKMYFLLLRVLWRSRHCRQHLTALRCWAVRVQPYPLRALLAVIAQTLGPQQFPRQQSHQYSVAQCQMTMRTWQTLVSTYSSCCSSVAVCCKAKSFLFVVLFMVLFSFYFVWKLCYVWVVFVCGIVKRMFLQDIFVFFHERLETELRKRTNLLICTLHDRNKNVKWNLNNAPICPLVLSCIFVCFLMYFVCLFICLSVCYVCLLFVFHTNLCLYSCWSQCINALQNAV